MGLGSFEQYSELSEKCLFITNYLESALANQDSEIIRFFSTPIAYLVPAIIAFALSGCFVATMATMIKLMFIGFSVPIPILNILLGICTIILAPCIFGALPLIPVGIAFISYGKEDETLDETMLDEDE